MTSAQRRPTKPHVAITVVNWNGGDDTAECLRSLCNLDYPCYRIWLVDNGSSDGSGEWLHAQFPEAEYIGLGENQGLVAGHNAAIQQALADGADYIFMLNNDTVIEADCLSHLVATAEADPRIGIVGALNFYYDQPSVVWYGGGHVNWCTGEVYDPASFKTELGWLPELRDVDHVTGSALLIRAKTVSRIGLMEERFNLQYEDNDWCLRAKRNGWRVVACRGARILHKVSRTIGYPLVWYYGTRNKPLFMWRNAPRRYLPLFFVWCILNSLRLLLRFYWRGEVANFVAIGAGLTDFCFGRYGLGRSQWVRQFVGRRPRGVLWALSAPRIAGAIRLWCGERAYANIRDWARGGGRCEAHGEGPGLNLRGVSRKPNGKQNLR